MITSGIITTIKTTIRLKVMFREAELILEATFKVVGITEADTMVLNKAKEVEDGIDMTYPTFLK